MPSLDVGNISSHTSKHISANSYTSKTTSNNTPSSSIKSLLCFLPRKARPNNSSVIFMVIVDLIQVLRRDQQSILDTGKSIIRHMTTRFDSKESLHVVQILDDL